ncbi:type I polyketide synthase [Tsukamurella pulmonis]|uniref:type I polyketide synthase n=3 Tax=Tsukamurella pulmonis TaxID=47312 RepID=UPI000B2A8757|nr:type I polyketide synthase [Tsukamurella pulmonis]
MTETDRTPSTAGTAARGSTYARVRAMSGSQRDALTDQFAKAARITAAEPIAVVGIGCRFPGGANAPQQYWDLLMRGQDAVVEVPPDRWDADAYYDPDPAVPGRMPSKWGGFLDGIAGFDADHFGIAPREAETMDPQQRILLEVAWEALEHAGISAQSAEGVRAAVMMGVYYNEYQSTSAADPEKIDAYSATGNAHSVTVGRIAYLLGLRGPAIAVDTACSSSLVSVHLACQSLRSRESDLALAGGVSLILRPETQLALGKWGMLSPLGRCHSFDAAADGFVRGEGCGVVVLKRLTDAVRDGDRVLAVVRGSATNQDGRSNGLTAPNAPAQREVITRALGEVPASSVHFVETHGTGTALGDPIEFDALAQVYGAGESRCALGAVKTNMGHLEAAAGIAGFIKSVLAVHRGQVPPNLHFTRWNPAIDAASTRLYVPTEADPWPAAGGPRRAAVSSFGLGGTNAHVVLEQGPDPEPAAPAGAGPAVLRIGAGSAEAVAARAADLAAWLAGKGAAAALTDVAHTVARQGAGAAVVGAVTARDTAATVEGLRALAAGASRPGVTAAAPRPRPGVVFAFSGQGSQWPGMGRRLLAEEPAFAAAVDRIEPEFVAQVGFSLRETLQSGEPVEGIDRIQPVLVGVQLALAELWRAHGVTPDAVIGHSMGEVTAAVVAGGLTVAEGLRVIATRSALMRRELSGQGAMALLEMDVASVEELLTAHEGVSVAVVASPRQTVVAGSTQAVDAVVAAVSARNLLARRVEVDVASHHATVDPILPELRTALAGLRPVPPTIPVLSTVRPGEQAPVFDADYWVDNLRRPVSFAPVAADAAARFGTLIEVSPHPVLTHALADNVPAGRDVAVLPTLLRDEDESIVFHAHRARLGGEPPAGRIIDVPPHSWRHQQYWTSASPGRRTGTGGAHPLLGDRVDLPSGTGVLWHGDTGLDALPWLADHRVQGQPIMPAAGFAEIALAAGRAALGAEAVAVTRLEVEQMLPLTESVPLTTQLTHEPDGTALVEVFHRTAAGEWVRHVRAHVGALPAGEAATPVGAPADGAPVSPRAVYAALRRAGAHHDRAFAALERVLRDPAGAAEADVVLPSEATAHPALLLHPVALDAALQTLAAALPDEAADGDAAYLPVAVEAVRLHRPVGRRALCRARITTVGDEGVSGDVTVLDSTGTVAVEVRGVFLRRIHRRSVPLPLERKLFGHRWETVPTPAPADATDPEGWLVLADDDGAAGAAADALAAPHRRIVTAGLDERGLADAVARFAEDPAHAPVGVVLLVDGAPSSTGGAEAAEAVIWRAASVVRAVTSGWHGRSPRLWLITRDGLAVRDGDVPDPAAGALTGLVRVLAYEHPDLRATVLDLPAGADLADALARESAAPDADDLIAWRDGERYVQRLVRRDSAPAEAPAVRGDGAYLVTGGLGGIGLVIARRLVAAGAGRVVLSGRGEPSPEADAALAELRAGADVQYVRGDVAEPGVAERLVAVAEETGLALRGVIHSAAVLDDELVAAMSRDALGRVWRPKAIGADRLDAATAEHDLDWWVLFSSVASLLGSPGQGAYAAANAYLDALAERRRAGGRTATAICWGQWSEVGLARSLEMGVLDPISPAEGTEALDAILGGGHTRVGVARLRLDRAASAFPELAGLGYFTHLLAELEPEEDAGAIDLAALTALPFAAAVTVVLDRLRQRIGAVLGYSGGAGIAADRPLTELGLDSLMAVRIRNAARGEFGIEPPVALLLQGADLTALAVDLVRRLGIDDDTDETAAAPGGLRDRAQQRAAARRRGAARRKAGNTA